MQAYILERKAFADDAAFWEKYSELNPQTGKVERLKWIHILQRIRARRKHLDAKDAEQARTEFLRPQFEEMFCYKKGGSRHVYSKAADIARVYRRLKGRPQPWDDAGE
jgi:hypothetical protein